jgi:hypothetical protein
MQKKQPKKPSQTRKKKKKKLQRTKRRRSGRRRVKHILLLRRKVAKSWLQMQRELLLTVLFPLPLSKTNPTMIKIVKSLLLPLAKAKPRKKR